MFELTDYVVMYDISKLKEKKGRLVEKICTDAPVVIPDALLASELGAKIGKPGNSNPDIQVVTGDIHTSTHQGVLTYNSKDGTIFYTDKSMITLEAAVRDNAGDAYLCEVGNPVNLYPATLEHNHRAYIAFGINDSKLQLNELLQMPPYLGTILMRMDRLPRHVVKLWLEPKK